MDGGNTAHGGPLDMKVAAMVWMITILVTCPCMLILVGESMENRNDSSGGTYIQVPHSLRYRRGGYALQLLVEMFMIFYLVAHLLPTCSPPRVGDADDPQTTTAPPAEDCEIPLEARMALVCLFVCSLKVVPYFTRMCAVDVNVDPPSTPRSLLQSYKLYVAGLLACMIFYLLSAMAYLHQAVSHPQRLLLYILMGTASNMLVAFDCLWLVSRAWFLGIRVLFPRLTEVRPISYRKLNNTAGRRSDIWLGSGDCTICLECFRDEDSVVPLPCGHVFHTECAQDWLDKRMGCPIHSSQSMQVIIVKADKTLTNSLHACHECLVSICSRGKACNEPTWDDVTPISLPPPVVINAQNLPPRE
jgi:hypothetical protein